MSKNFLKLKYFQMYISKSSLHIKSARAHAWFSDPPLHMCLLYTLLASAGSEYVTCPGTAAETHQGWCYGDVSTFKSGSKLEVWTFNFIQTGWMLLNRNPWQKPTTTIITDEILNEYCFLEFVSNYCQLRSISKDKTLQFIVTWY